jgi:hypothetical protein
MEDVTTSRRIHVATTSEKGKETEPVLMASPACSPVKLMLNVWLPKL